MKKVVSLLMALCLMSTCTAALAAPAGTLSNDYEGLTQIGTALGDGHGGYLLPLRAIWEASGTTVTWDSNTKTVHVQYNGADAFVFTVGGTFMELPGSIVLPGNERKFDLGGPVVIIDGKACAPAANLSNYMGIKINPETHGIYMTVVPAQQYTVYDGKKPLSKEELQKATWLTIINVDSLDFLRDAKSLTHLKAGNSDLPDPGQYAATVSGDISALGGLTNLTFVNLVNTNVAGDIGSLSGLENLQDLYLNFTKVSGDISVLSKLPNLNVMALMSDGITGNLSALSGMTGLQDIMLSGKNITGDLSVLSGLTSLQYISLTSTANVTGDISALNGLNLTGLSFIDTDLTVDLNTVGGFKNLMYLSLRSPYVTGDIGALRGLTGLVQLMITTPKVTGDISALSGMTNLVHVFLSSTGVNGDIKALGGLTNVMILNLASTKVTGDIGALKGLEKLTYLDLSATGVTGDIGALAGLKNLGQINITGSKVTGSTAASKAGS